MTTTPNTPASGAADDSLLICASDLQHSAIYDNPHEMVDCVRAVADRITALAASAPVAPTKMPIPPSPADPLDVVYAEGWNAACEAFFGGKPPADALVITVTEAAPVAPAPQPAPVKIVRDFRWDSAQQHHVPTLLLEFEPVPANSPIDAKGWNDRDDVAIMLAAAPKADHIPEAGEKVALAAPAVTAQGQYYDAYFASSGHRPYFLPFSARTAIAARHGTHVTKEFNALVADVVSEFMARHLATPAAPAPVAEDVEIRKALDDAATSLETISRIAGKDQYMLEMVDVRIYAAARAKVARDAQAAQPEGGA